MAVLDLIIIAAVLAFALVGLWLGFARVAFGIGAWVGAGLATVYGFPYARPLAHRWIEGAFLADLAAGAAIFIASLAVLVVISHMIADRVRSGGLGAVNRSVGLAAGLALGAVMVSVGWLILEGMLGLPEDRGRHPDWLRESKAAPVVAWSSRKLLAVVPEEWRAASGRDLVPEPSSEEIGEAVKKLTSPVPETAAPDEKPGYNESERRELNRLFNTHQDGAN